MIGWRIGWVAGPASIMSDIARVHIYNVVTPTGIAQVGALTALRTPDTDMTDCVNEWERRRNTVREQLQDLPIYPAAGGWSMLLDVTAFGYDSVAASRLLLERGKIAATEICSNLWQKEARYASDMERQELLHNDTLSRERTATSLSNSLGGMMIPSLPLTCLRPSSVTRGGHSSDRCPPSQNRYCQYMIHGGYMSYR